ncbi:MAG: amino acid permease, partial [Verrucomicrobiota bacterium]
IVEPIVTPVAELAPEKMSAPLRTIGFFTATGIVIANIIGTGVFTSLGFQLPAIQSGFALLMLWIVGGIAALCGALCYGELSAALPRSGGEYHFLSRIYHPALGFMAGIVSATVGFAAPIALAAMAFGKYFQGVFNTGSPIVFSIAVVWIVALFHLSNLRVGSVFQNLWTLVKVLLIVALIVAGFLVDPKQPITFLPQPGDATSIFAAPFAIALVYVMYSYSGWNAASYITNEIKQPEKNVPRSLFWGTLLVIGIYTALNAAFLVAAPRQEMSGQLEVALIAGKHIFGEGGGRIVGGIICLGLVSAISSMTWLGPRVTMSMGEDHSALRFLGHKNSHGIPIYAALVQLVLVNLFFLKNFQAVVIYIQFNLLLCSLLTVAGVIVLRWTHPELVRPYRVWAYPLPPLIFIGITLWMMIYLLQSNPIESLSGVATLLAGFALYYFAGKRRQSPQ